eukprot:1143871-Pelagomonas_calceolata.AAC.4
MEGNDPAGHDGVSTSCITPIADVRMLRLPRIRFKALAMHLHCKGTFECKLPSLHQSLSLLQSLHKAEGIFWRIKVSMLNPQQ